VGEKREEEMIRIGVVGGGFLSGDVLEKTHSDDHANDLGARIVALADPVPSNPGAVKAREMGLRVTRDYNDFLTPDSDIDFVIVMSSDKKIYEEILKKKPGHVGVLPYPVFDMLWRAATLDEARERARKEEIETILNAIEDFIVVITPEREIVDVNEAFLRKMGYRREEVVGRKCHEIFQILPEPCEGVDFVCPLEQVIRNRRADQQVLTRVDHKGELRHVEVSMFPIWGKEGELSRFIEISRDVTDRLQQEEKVRLRLEKMVEARTRQLRETHEKLLHQDKMASLGKLSASVVHELNNPIAGILNFILLMKRILDENHMDADGIARFLQYLELMETETRRVSRIASNLLSFSRQSKIELKRIDLNRLLDKTLMINQNLLKINQVTVNKSLSPDMPMILGSEDQLQQVFMNLISNAVEAMEGGKGGVLQIETRRLPEDAQVMITFEDAGIGIPPENIPRLFEPFFTTKKKGKGVGLGLSVAYGIIREHEGEIHVDSVPGKGTKFEIVLPEKRKNGGRHEHSQDSHSG